MSAQTVRKIFFCHSRPDRESRKV